MIKILFEMILFIFFWILKVSVYLVIIILKLIPLQVYVSMLILFIIGYILSIIRK